MEAMALFGFKLGMRCMTSGTYWEAINCFKNSLMYINWQEKVDQEMILQCYYLLGICYERLDKYSEAVMNFEQSLNIFKKKGDQQMVARCHFSLGMCYQKLDKYSEAVMNYKKSLSMFQESGDQEIAAQCFNYYDLGECYRMLDRYSEAALNYEQSLSMFKEKDNQEMIAQCYSCLGICYRKLDKYSKAVMNYEQSLTMFQAKGNQETAAQSCIYYNLGECYRMMDKYSEAVMNYEQSFSTIISLKLMEKEMERKVCYGLGDSLMHLHRFQEAKEYLDKALTIAKQIGEWEEWSCNDILSKLHYQQRQFQKALDYAERALEIADQMNATEEKQMTYRVLGDALAPLGRVKEAIDYHERYLTYTKQVGYRKEEGQTFCSLSVCYMEIHDFDKATMYAENGAKIAKETGDFNTEGKAYGCIANALRKRGKVDPAFEYCFKELEISTQEGDKLSEASSNNNLGFLFMTLGKHYDAIRCFQTSMKLNSEQGFENNNGAAYNNLGVLFVRVGKHQEAAEFLKKCLNIVKDNGEISNEISAYQNLSSVYYESKNYDLARECRWESIILAIRTGNKRGEIDYFRYLGSCFCKIGKITQAISSHQKALFFAFRINSFNYIGNCYSDLGGTCNHFGMVDEAIRFYEKSLKIFTDTGDKENEAVCRYDIGRIYIRLSQKQKLCNDHVQSARNLKTSEQYFRESLQYYEEVFDDLREKQEFKMSIVDTYVRIYNDLALLLIETDRTTEALVVCERGRACALVDTLVCKYGMHQQQVFVENMSIRKPLNESDLTVLLPKESSLLFYSFIYESEHLWVLSQQRPLIYAHNDMQQNITTKKNTKEYIYQLADSAYQSMHVRQMAANCEDRSLGKQEPSYSKGVDDQSQLSNSIVKMTLKQNSEYSSSSRNPPESTSIGSDQHNDINCKEPLKELFKQLITPVQEHLTQEEVIIIPDGPLNLVPFAALRDPQTGRFLCETKRIRLAPSLTTLKVLKECPDDYHSKKGALVIGNPLVGEVMFRGEKETFSSIPNAEMEARVVSSILGVSPFIGIDATKDAVKEKLQQDAAVIHIAAHGDDITGEIALAPGISTQPKAIPEEKDYILTMQEVQEIGVCAKLVVLSCCHSGRGEIRAEGVVGMARAFLAAGVRAVVASLWAIDDEATMDFMAGFYMHLRKGMSASVSLNESMKELIREKKYSHPKYWAPFVLIGDDVTIF